MTSQENEIKNMVKKLGQFPYNRRRSNYQSYYLGNKYEQGSRDTMHRLTFMRIPSDLSDFSVLDLGCQIGALCAEAYNRGSRFIYGLDMREDYIYCAKELAEYNNHNIHYVQMDICNTHDVLDCIGNYTFDIVFLLSMFKHLKGRGFTTLKELKWKTAYIESNNCPTGYKSKQAIIMEMHMRKLWPDLDIQRLGVIQDRGSRCIWKLN